MESQFSSGIPDVIGRSVQTSIDFTQSAWNTVATHRVFTVTGLVRCRMVYRITGSLTSGGAATISFGYTGSVAAYSTAVVLGGLTSGKIMRAGVGAPSAIVAAGEIIEHATNQTDVFLDAIHIGYEILLFALTGGSIIANCIWNPISSDGNVVSASGGTL